MEINVTIDATENNYGAISDEVIICFATGNTLNEVKANYESALKFHLEEKNLKKYKLNYTLTLEARLVYYDKVFKRAFLSK